jgi:hypothetical protein
MKLQFFLYVIILGLVINLLANMIWKYIPGTNRHFDKIVTAALVSICIILLILHQEDSSVDASQQNIESLNNIQSGINKIRQSQLSPEDLNIELSNIYNDIENLYKEINVEQLISASINQQQIITKLSEINESISSKPLEEAETYVKHIDLFDSKLNGVESKIQSMGEIRNTIAKLASELPKITAEDSRIEELLAKNKRIQDVMQTLTNQSDVIRMGIVSARNTIDQKKRTIQEPSPRQLPIQPAESRSTLTTKTFKTGRFTSDQQAQLDMENRAARDRRFGSSRPGSLRVYEGYLPPPWEPWEPRLMLFDFMGDNDRTGRISHITGIVTMWHAIYKSDPSIRWTIFLDPDTGEWVQWERGN